LVPPGGSNLHHLALIWSLPQEVIQRLNEQTKLLSFKEVQTKLTDSERRIRQAKGSFALVDRMLDRAETGPLWLGLSPIAQLFADALLIRYQNLYALWSYVVMASHVHVFIQPKVAQTSVSKQIPEFVPPSYNEGSEGIYSPRSQPHLGSDGSTFLANRII